LADLGYFKVKVFEELNEQGVWWVSRVPARSGIWQGEQVIHTADWLKEQQGNCIDQPVELTAQRLPCRLLAIRVPDEVAEERKKRARKAARKRKNSQLKPETLALCEWTILVTNLPPESYSLADILCLQRLRWQIELLFKLWKSELSLDDWRSQQPHQILSELYAKLILALVQHWLLLLGCWQVESRSLVKATRVLRKHAFHILSALADSRFLIRTLRLILPSLARCTVQKRKTRPATFQLLSRAIP
jgi:IS4 transposase